MTFRYFGTDGIRGRVGHAPVTPDFVLKLGWALGKVLQEQYDSATVLIGKDTRVSGYMFESALQAGLSASGTDILLVGPLTTPAVAYLTRTFNAQASVVITASHNTYKDNGFKIFSANGRKLSDVMQQRIEHFIDLPLQTTKAAKLGRAARMTDARGRYIEFCKSTLDSSMDLHGIRLVLDCANGASYDIAPSVFTELGADVIAVNIHPDGLNINEQCGSTHPDSLQHHVKTYRADYGIAFDGDGDRSIMADRDGNIYDGDDYLYTIARHWMSVGKLDGAVIGTIMSNQALEQAFRRLSVPFYRANVGDRHVLAAVEQHGANLGGEPSGHVICPQFNSAGDGIIASLQMLTSLRQLNWDTPTLREHYTPYPSELENIIIEREIVKRHKEEIAAIAARANTNLGAAGRVLIRPSGTEKKLRVLVECNDTDTTLATIASVVTELNTLLG